MTLGCGGPSLIENLWNITTRSEKGEIVNVGYRFGLLSIYFPLTFTLLWSDSSSTVAPVSYIEEILGKYNAARRY
jgi:hypothetical protein